jgi:hypothetical protein
MKKGKKRERERNMNVLKYKASKVRIQSRPKIFSTFFAHVHSHIVQSYLFAKNSREHVPKWQSASSTAVSTI